MYLCYALSKNSMRLTVENIHSEADEHILLANQEAEFLLSYLSPKHVSASTSPLSR